MADDIIDLNAERNKRAEPDPEFVRQDDFGRKLYHFLLNYEMDGKDWSAEVWAYDEADAENRVQAMRGTLKLMGQTFEMIPA